MNKTRKVLEIGAGLGRTAYYALQLGVKSYTIIDLPLTGVAQAYFLGRVIREDRISLWGEQQVRQITILPPIAFHESDEQYDLVVNVDSLTEMAEETARDYIATAQKRAPVFLSINHENNSFTVAKLLQERDDVRVWRSPFWLRRGYVEEVVEFKTPPATER